jgi:hypothetical protein
MNADNLAEVFDLLHVVRKDLGRSASDTDFDREVNLPEQALQKAGILRARVIPK